MGSLNILLTPLDKIIVIVCLLLIINSCKKTDENPFSGLPAVTTKTVINITGNSAESGGTIKFNGGSLISNFGICWGTSQNPTRGQYSREFFDDSLQAGNFICLMTGLNPYTTYYVRAYATNKNGTTYGNQVSFTTTAAALPTLYSTMESGSITMNSANCNTTISAGNGVSISSKGVCWSSTSTSPGVSLTTKTSDGSGSGSFSSSITGLSPNTTYYLRGYANISGTTVYGNTVTFSTSALPTLYSTMESGSITMNSANCNTTISAGSGITISAKGVCWSSTSTSPTISLTTKTSDGSGSGSFSSSITGLSPNTTYYLRGYANISGTTVYGNTLTFTTSAIPTTVTDINGNMYNTVVIGSQVWMAENLKVASYRNGSSISNLSSNSTTWSTTTSGAYSIYNNISSNNSTYGKLYNWHAVTDARGLCPQGWHVPTDADWNILVNYLGSNAGGKMKSTSLLWNQPNTSATNSSGFTGLPGGYRNSSGSFLDLNNYGYWWSSSNYSSSTAPYRSLSYSSASLSSAYANKNTGYCIRCLMD